MAVFRFPNSQSDLDRLVRQLEYIAEDFNDSTATFSLDDMRDSLAKRSQISSSGASGDLAIRKSTRVDRSRDPLYNQVKMMSELYRMFGWIRSIPGSRLDFRMTNLGLTLALDAARWGASYRNDLIAESLVSTVFPNETTTNVGIHNLRPFCWLLRLTHALDGFITRDEIIIGLIAVTDDLAKGEFETIVSKIMLARVSGNTPDLVSDLATKNRIQVNTLQNYTRLPIGALNSNLLGWARVENRVVKPGARPIRVFALTPSGLALAADLASRFDVRLSHLAHLPLPLRATLADFGFYEMLTYAGLPLDSVAGELNELRLAAEPTLRGLGWNDGQRILFNPELQEKDEVLNMLDD